MDEFEIPTKRTYNAFDDVTYLEKLVFKAIFMWMDLDDFLVAGQKDVVHFCMKSYRD